MCHCICVWWGQPVKGTDSRTKIELNRLSSCVFSFVECVCVLTPSRKASIWMSLSLSFFLSFSFSLSPSLCVWIRANLALFHAVSLSLSLSLFLSPSEKWVTQWPSSPPQLPKLVLFIQLSVTGRKGQYKWNLHTTDCKGTNGLRETTQALFVTTGMCRLNNMQ